MPQMAVQPRIRVLAHRTGVENDDVRFLAVRVLKARREQDAAQLIPYQENIDRYERAGLPVGAYEQSLTVSNMNVWQLFNILTAFATHNQLWPAHDTRRSELMAQSVELLNQKRDIRTYQNIYG